MKAIMNVLTAIAAIVGIAGVVIGIVTGTAHNIVLGVMMVIVGYANHYEEAEA